MARIPREIVDSIRERTDIREVVARYVSLNNRGRNAVGLCPFHQEKTPSFNVIPDKGIFHCFGCQTGGDVFKFLMLIDGLSFVESVKELATAAGVVIEERELSPSERKALRRRSSQFEILEAAGSWFESNLWTTNEGASARHYIQHTRRFDEEFSRKSGLGFAPSGWSGLIDNLHKQGISSAELSQVGLARARKQGDGYYDMFRNRLIIPIKDERGRIIAFGGRLLEGDGPKYINSPETSLYQKSKVLYGMHAARPAIQRKGRCFVVEGYFDVLAMQQAGYAETVATCGTALTTEHLAMLRRLTKDVIMVMDSDEAGQNAAEKALALFMDVGLQAWRLQLPGAKDPDELLREEGPDAINAVIEAKEPLLEWVIGRMLTKVGASAISKDRVFNQIQPWLLRLKDPFLIQRVSNRLGWPEATVLERLKRAPRVRQTDHTPAPVRTGWRANRDMVHVLWLLVHHRNVVSDLLSKIDIKYIDEPVRETIARLLSGEPVAALIEEISDPGVVKTLVAVVARSELYTEDHAVAALCQVLLRLAAPHHHAEASALAEALSAAEKSGQMTEFVALVKKKRDVDLSQRELKRLLNQEHYDEFAQRLGPKNPDIDAGAVALRPDQG